jgi:hypothetical protein
VKDEPVLNGAAVKLLVTVITWLAARYVPGFELSVDQANYLALCVLGLATAGWAWITRSKVMPVSKVEDRLANDHPAALAALKRQS